MFRKQEGVFYSKRALDYLDIAVSKYDIFSHIEDESYQKELDALLDYMIFTNEDKKKFMEVLMYCIGFRSDVALVDAVTSLCVSLELAKKLELSEGSSEKLYYGSLVHDIGMLSVPASIIEAPRKLTDSEIVEMRTHVEKEERILLNRLDEEIVSIATMHHERLDGSGYPKGLKGSMMSKEQFIVQLADVVTGLTCERSYRKSKSKDVAKDNIVKLSIVVEGLNTKGLAGDKLLGESEVSNLSTEVAGGFVGCCIGMYASGNGKDGGYVSFKNFTYSK